jgi:hypothetical protein
LKKALKRHREGMVKAWKWHEKGMLGGTKKACVGCGVV